MAALKAERARRLLAAIEAIKRRNRKKDARQAEARASLSDPEARGMHFADGGFRPAHNGQLTCDVGSGVMVAVAITDRGSDRGLPRPAVEHPEQTFGFRPAEALPDGGYVTASDIEQLDACGTAVFAPPAGPRRGDASSGTSGSAVRGSTPGALVWQPPRARRSTVCGPRPPSGSTPWPATGACSSSASGASPGPDQCSTGSPWSTPGPHRGLAEGARHMSGTRDGRAALRPSRHRVWCLNPAPDPADPTTGRG